MELCRSCASGSSQHGNACIKCQVRPNAAISKGGKGRIGRVRHQLGLPESQLERSVPVPSPLCLVGGTLGLASSASTCIPEQWDCGSQRT